MPLSADPCHALTIDLEEWHHVCGVPSLDRERPSLPSRVDGDTRRTLDLLDRTGTRATFFVLGNVAQSHPRLVEAVASAGHEIACHGHDHQLATETDQSGFAADLQKATRTLESITGTRPSGHRSAGWSLGRARFDGLAAVARAGYRYDSSLVSFRPLGRPGFPTWPIRVLTSAGPLEEWPPLSSSSPFGRYPVGFALGLRLLPNGLILRHLARLARRGLRAVIALHVWELDPDPPRYRLPLPLHVAHYAGLEGMERKIDDLLRRVRLERIDRLPPPQEVGTASDA